MLERKKRKEVEKKKKLRPVFIKKKRRNQKSNVYLSEINVQESIHCSNLDLLFFFQKKKEVKSQVFIDVSVSQKREKEVKKGTKIEVKRRHYLPNCMRHDY